MLRWLESILACIATLPTCMWTSASDLGPQALGSFQGLMGHRSFAIALPTEALRLTTALDFCPGYLCSCRTMHPPAMYLIRDQSHGRTTASMLFFLNPHFRPDEPWTVSGDNRIQRPGGGGRDDSALGRNRGVTSQIPCARRPESCLPPHAPAGPPLAFSILVIPTEYIHIYEWTICSGKMLR